MAECGWPKVFGYGVFAEEKNLGGKTLKKPLADCDSGDDADSR